MSDGGGDFSADTPVRASAGTDRERRGSSSRISAPRRVKASTSRIPISPIRRNDGPFTSTPETHVR